jgi:hypothetical protein
VKANYTGTLEPELQNQLLKDINDNPTLTFKGIYDLNPDPYGTVRSKRYRAGENRFNYLKKLKEREPDRYWTLYASANTQGTTDPEDLSSEEDYEAEVVLEDDDDDEEEAVDEQEEAEELVTTDKPPNVKSTNTSLRPSLVPSSAYSETATAHSTMDPAQQRPQGIMFESLSEAKRSIVYGKVSCHSCIHG